MTLDDYCADLRNYFIADFDNDIYVDKFTISNSKISLDFLDNNQYFRIVGSKFNDGVYKYDNELTLVDETFDGGIWAMSVPPAFLEAVKESEQYLIDHPMGTEYTSESFGGYSYTRAESRTSKNSLISCLPASLSSRLNRYRRLRVI